jgi:ACS family D-galactonate transporter-like MFS transporter
MTKWKVVGFLGGVAFVTDIIRSSMGMVAPVLIQNYGISEQDMGWILSAWRWGYTPGLLLTAPIVDRLGVWMVMGLGSALWGGATLLLPLGSAVMWLFAMRFLFGLGHSMRIPGQAAAVSKWFGADQRATAIGLCFFGGQVGSAFAPPVVAILLGSFAWTTAYYVIGAGSLVFTLVWFSFYPSGEAAASPPVATEESTAPEESASAAPQVSWLALFRYRATWGIALGQMGYLYAYFFFISWFPSYLALERGMSLLRTGFTTSALFIMGMVAVVTGGWLGDALIRRGISRNVSRKGIIGSGLTLATILVVTAAFTSNNQVAVVLFVFCMGSLRMTTASANSIPIDLAPKGAVATLTSIQNFAGNFSGLLVTIVTGYLVQTSGSFVLPLVVAGGMAIMGAICFVFVVGPLETLKPVDQQTK